jgi:hypothetical protein
VLWRRVASIAEVCAEVAMTEEEAREVLIASGNRDGLEVWVAAQPWTPMPNGTGWQIEGSRDGCHFEVRPAIRAVRVINLPPEGKAAAIWTVTGS